MERKGAGKGSRRCRKLIGSRKRSTKLRWQLKEPLKPLPLKQLLTRPTIPELTTHLRTLPVLRAGAVPVGVALILDIDLPPSTNPCDVVDASCTPLHF